jgi:hypothetical protein
MQYVAMFLVLSTSQEVSLLESSAKQQTMRKATSVPNIANQQGTAVSSYFNGNDSYRQETTKDSHFL